MNETNQKEYWVGADVVFIPGREAGELAEAYGITDPERAPRKSHSRSGARSSQVHFGSRYR